MTKRTKNDRILRWLKRRENKYSKLFREFENKSDKCFISTI